MTKESAKKPKPKDIKRTHKKVFDVVRPGKSLALPNSRSVIMGHKRQVQDDQFVAGGGSISSSSSGARSDSGADEAGTALAKPREAEAIARQTAPRLAGDPFEKHPLLDSHEKVDLKPGTDSGSAPKEDASNKSVAARSAPTSPETTTASVLPKASTPAAASTAPLVSSDTNTATASFGAHDNLATSEILADLAVEQVVEDPASFESSPTNVDRSINAGTASGGGSSAGTQNGDADGSNAAGSVPAGNAAPTAAGDAPLPKTVDDLLAETGAPDLSSQKAIVSTHHHRGSFFHIVLSFLLILIVGIVALNFLLDAGIIETELDLPYTDLIK